MKLFDNVKALVSVVPAVHTADANGTGVDTLGHRDGMLLVQAGDIDLANADETYVIELEESVDNSTWVDVAGISVTITADNEVGVARISELNVVRSRYLRAVINVGGTTPSFPVAATFLFAESYAGPQNTD